MIWWKNFCSPVLKVASLEPSWAELCYLIISIPQKLECQETDEFICSYLWFITWWSFLVTAWPERCISKCEGLSLLLLTPACRNGAGTWSDQSSQPLHLFVVIQLLVDFQNQISSSILFPSLYFAKENLFKAKEEVSSHGPVRTCIFVTTMLLPSNIAHRYLQNIYPDWPNLLDHSTQFQDSIFLRLAV